MKFKTDTRVSYQKSINTENSLTKQTSSSKRCIRLFLISIVFLSCTTIGFTQNQILIEGMVADSATFKPMAYVNIVVKNKLKGSQSDQSGSFRLSATAMDTLLFSFVGYKTQEIPLFGWETSIILMAEDPLILESVTIEDVRLKDSDYEEIFKDQNAIWEKQNKKLPFYYSRQKKEAKKIARLENENARVQTYLDVVVHNNELKELLMKKYNLDEKKFYDLMTRFNEQNHKVMYYLSASELVSLIYRFYEANASR